MKSGSNSRENENKQKRTAQIYKTSLRGHDAEKIMSTLKKVKFMYSYYESLYLFVFIFCCYKTP